ASLGWLASWAAAWLELVARVFGGLPSAQIGTHLALLPLAGTAAAFFVLAAVWIVALRPAPVAWSAPAAFRVTFLDVGQGDSTLLETPTARVLVDEGPPEADAPGQLPRMGIPSV